VKYQGAQDGTFYLLLRELYREQLSLFAPIRLEKGIDYRFKELRRKNKSLEGDLSHTVGLLAEYQLAFELQSRSPFFMSSFFDWNTDQAPELKDATEKKEFAVKEILLRQYLQLPNGIKREIDLIVLSPDDRVLLVEVKKRRERTSKPTAEEFWEKVGCYRSQNPELKVFAAFFSLGGFYEPALDFCREKKIGTVTKLNYAAWSSFK